MIEKLLVANRGEIAVRIIRAAREMGIRTVAVFSDADADALHVGLADESVALGDSQPSTSYLNSSKIIAAALETGADAIHPGYGFLSERAEFSEDCASAGIQFVGPPGSAMRLLGSKAAAKALAVQESVPIVPGMYALDATREDLRHAAEEIGYPVMLKATAGGGGRGMRVVRDPARFNEELDTASDEALKAFGNGAMMVEKLVDRPRHIEVQLLADIFANVACLFERECSLQRRHQKLVEEAPSPYLSQHDAMWTAMSGAARRLALASGYVGAGTVEFMVDEASGQFYFLEVNARLQVEHPVTEAITGVDLVQSQLRIASGLPLELREPLMDGEHSAAIGHSIEARIVAEDPANGFLPSVGRILAWAEPVGPGVRVDTGYGPDAEISRFYDSLIAKVIVHAETRSMAIQRLRSALMDFHVLGVKTNIAYLLDVLDHPSFREGRIDTGFLGREFENWSPGAVPAELGAMLKWASSASGNSARPSQACTIWDSTDSFRNTI